MRVFAFLGALLLTDTAYAQAHDHAGPSDAGTASSSTSANLQDQSQNLSPPTSVDLPKKKRRVLYYKNPMGGADTSPVPKKDSMGMDYIPVYESEAAPATGKGAVLYYKNPMGEPNTSPVPKKDSMGMDYIPVYEADIPPTISDHAADRFFDANQMATARELLKTEHGGARTSFISVNILELQSRQGEDGYRWESEAWYGGDASRAVIKFKGEGAVDGALEDAEIQALFARPIDPYFNLQAGLRYDINPSPSRAYVTVGVEGLAPYWFEVGGAVFASNKGDLHARLEGYYDLNITQRVVLQPRAEIDISAQNVPELNIGAGVATFEAELRLRYEIRREFAPYIGVSIERKVGRTADMARSAGEPASSTSLVAGVRLFF